MRDMIQSTADVAGSPGGIDPKALFNLSYGLFVVTARQDGQDNGCITNTVMQITSTPNRIALSLNKANLTHDMILTTGVVNVSILTEDAPFALFQRFGYQSGREADKFAGFSGAKRSENGLYYLAEQANALLSGRVISTMDCGTHTLFLAEITECAVLSARPSVTYTYYFANIKPKPVPTKKKGWVCKICGYVYEGEVLPPDFICPICKHGAADFEPLGDITEKPPAAIIPEQKGERTMKHVCGICGWEYDEAAGDPANGIAPGT
ncbi:MAG: flavin reductase, partial [Eubacteriales bacterium]|nr:flavin reductase [Eubacteriales bacterium]